MAGAFFAAGRKPAGRPAAARVDVLERTADALDVINGRRSTCKVVIRVTAE
jgi:hypothetical protein